MTTRKVASLTSGLLARKGAARPADLPPEEEDKGWLEAPAEADRKMPDAEPPDRGPADRMAPDSPTADRNDAATRDLRAYAWPTQGAPSAGAPAAGAAAGIAPAEDDLAMPSPPSAADVEQAIAAMRRRTTMRRLAVSGIAAAVVAGLVVIVVRDGRNDAARLTASSTPPAVTATPMSPTAPATASADAGPGATTGIKPSATIRSVPEETASEKSTPPKAAHEPVARRAMVDAAEKLREVAPAAGVPLPPRADMELTPRIPPVPTERGPAERVAALPKLPAERPAPINAMELKAPPIERQVERMAVAESTPLPKARPAERHPARTTVAKAVAGGRYAVQIASIGSKTRAGAERARLAKHLGPVLGGRALIVEQATVAGHGTVYRIRAAGYPTLAAAKKVCTQIKGHGLGCLVVRL